MFFTAFDSLLPEYKRITFYPKHLAKEIDELNDWVYDTVNNGYIIPSEMTNFRVYKTGVAITQKAYENNVYPLFTSLDRLDKILTNSKYLFGDTLTEADIRLYVTAIRFDAVYVQHFKCNIGMIRCE